MSNKKDICPQCKTNQKGIKSKTCQACSIQNLTAERSNKAGSKKVIIKPNEPLPEDSNKELIKPKVGELTSDGKYYL